MSAYLAIETSSNLPAVALSVDGVVVFNSSIRSDPVGDTDIGALVAEALSTGKVDARELTAVGVNTGPGGLGAVRSGVAFANALTYALRIPVKGFNFFEIAGRELAGQTHSAILSVIPAAGENVYLGLYRAGAVELARFGEPGAIASAFNCAKEVWAAGRLRKAAIGWLSECVVHDSGVEAPDPATILSLIEEIPAESLGTWTQAEPLTETSAFFHVKT